MHVAKHFCNQVVDLQHDTIPCRYNDVARWQEKDVYATTIALTSSAQIKLSKITKACKIVSLCTEFTEHWVYGFNSSCFIVQRHLWGAIT